MVPGAVTAAAGTGFATAVAVTFALSARSKLADPAAFRRSLTPTLGVAPMRARPLAAAVVTAEVAVVLGLITGLWWAPATLLGFTGAAALLGVFTVAIRSMIRRGVTEPCHCFGAADTPPGRVDLVRNAVLIAFCVAGTAVAATVGPAPGGSAVGPVAGLVTGGTAALLVVHLDDLRWLFGPVLPGVG